METNTNTENEYLLCVFLAGVTQPLVIKTKLNAGREAMQEWKKFLLYYSKPEFERGEEDKPYSIYHFLDSDNGLHASFVFGNVVAMQIHECKEDKKERA